MSKSAIDIVSYNDVYNDERFSIIFDLEDNFGKFKNLINMLDKFSDECKLFFTQDCLKIEVEDPSNQTHFDLRFDRADFDYFKCAEDCILTVSSENLKTLLGRLTATKNFNKTDLFQFIFCNYTKEIVLNIWKTVVRNGHFNGTRKRHSLSMSLCDFEKISCELEFTLMKIQIISLCLNLFSYSHIFFYY